MGIETLPGPALFVSSDMVKVDEGCCSVLYEWCETEGSCLGRRGCGATYGGQTRRFGVGSKRRDAVKCVVLFCSAVVGVVGVQEVNRGRTRHCTYE